MLYSLERTQSVPSKRVTSQPTDNGDTTRQLGDQAVSRQILDEQDVSRDHPSARLTWLYWILWNIHQVHQHSIHSHWMMRAQPKSAHSFPYTEKKKEKNLIQPPQSREHAPCDLTLHQERPPSMKQWKRQDNCKQEHLICSQPSGHTRP